MSTDAKAPSLALSPPITYTNLPSDTPAACTRSVGIGRIALHSHVEKLSECTDRASDRKISAYGVSKMRHRQIVKRAAERTCFAVRKTVSPENKTKFCVIEAAQVTSHCFCHSMGADTKMYPQGSLNSLTENVHSGTCKDFFFFSAFFACPGLFVPQRLQTADCRLQTLPIPVHAATAAFARLVHAGNPLVPNVGMADPHLRVVRVVGGRTSPAHFGYLQLTTLPTTLGLK